jgi:arylsulfatase A-like enzyme
MIEKKNYGRHEFLQLCFIIGIMTSFISSAACSFHKIQKRPNILLILSDDQGINDVSAYGSEILTPHIDAIGENGIRFTNFYVTAPVCTPSRFGLLTGRYQYRAAEAFQDALLPKNPDHTNVYLGKDEITIADIFKKEGYNTALIGKWHLGHGNVEFGPNSCGFDYFYGFLPGCIDYYKHSYEMNPALYRNKTLIEQEGYSTDLFTNETIHFIEKNKNSPFFLFLSYNAPHYGRCPDGNLLQSPPEAKSLPEKAVNDRVVYAAMVQNLDKGIGRIMRTLSKLQLEKNTIVIFLSDNGGTYNYGGNNKPYRGQKGTLWEGGIRVPCLMKWKGHIKEGHVSDQVLISLDLFPTLISLIEASLPNRTLDGINISDVLLQNRCIPDRYFFFKFKNQMVVRNKQWKYLKDNNDQEYLFDMINDVYEQNNVISENKFQAQLMRTEYKKFIKNL